MSLRSLTAIVLGALSGVALAALPALKPVSRPPEITFIPRTSGTLPTEAMHRGANLAVRGTGFRLYWNAPTREDDVDRQILLMSNALDDDTRGLILGPTNGLALTSTINEFVARGIPVGVVQTDAPVPLGPYITSVTPDQAEVVRLAAERKTFVKKGRCNEYVCVLVDSNRLSHIAFARPERPGVAGPWQAREFNAHIPQPQKLARAIPTCPPRVSFAHAVQGDVS